MFDKIPSLAQFEPGQLLCMGIVERKKRVRQRVVSS
jgi:hypothetical protein